MFVLDYTDSALEDLAYFRKYEQTLILDGVDRQLQHEPNKETRNRKVLDPNNLSQWELRIGVYRVFYDIISNARIVTIKAVGYKEHNKLFIRGKEYNL
jgi:mRNA-degrading endonuclease RelE of RelBE toxin-antitoxin system